MADIAFACEFALFARERKAAGYLNELGLPVISDLASYPRAAALVERLCAHPAFRPELEGAIPELTS